MPIYEYTCKKCKHDFEQLIMGSQKAVCPECGSRALERRFSVIAAPNQSGQRASGEVCQPTPGGG